MKSGEAGSKERVTFLVLLLLLQLVVVVAVAREARKKEISSSSSCGEAPGIGISGDGGASILVLPPPTFMPPPSPCLCLGRMVWNGSVGCLLLALSRCVRPCRRSSAIILLQPPLSRLHLHHPLPAKCNSRPTHDRLAMLAFRGVGTKLGLHRLPVSSTRPVLVSLPYHASQQQTRGVTKSSRSSKGTETSTTTNSSNSANGTSTSTRKRKGRDAGPPINAAFFKVDGANPPAVEGTGTAQGDGWVVGEVTDHAINLHDVRPVRRCFRKERRKDLDG